MQSSLTTHCVPCTAHTTLPGSGPVCLWGAGPHGSHGSPGPSPSTPGGCFVSWTQTTVQALRPLPGAQGPSTQWLLAGPGSRLLQTVVGLGWSVTILRAAGWPQPARPLPLVTALSCPSPSCTPLHICMASPVFINTSTSQPWVPRACAKILFPNKAPITGYGWAWIWGDTAQPAQAIRDMGMCGRGQLAICLAECHQVRDGGGLGRGQKRKESEGGSQESWLGQILALL